MFRRNAAFPYQIAKRRKNRVLLVMPFYGIIIISGNKHSMQYLTSKQNVGFASNAIQRRSEPHAFRFLGERTTFWVAALSVIAFVTGNMVGRHGWYTFWASVLGEGDENLIVYSGTVVPVALVPDYARWYAYGGGSKEHTFRQVPQDLLQELPLYDPVRERQPSDASPADDLFSIGHAGSYRRSE